MQNLRLYIGIFLATALLLLLLPLPLIGTALEEVPSTSESVGTDEPSAQDSMPVVSKYIIGEDIFHIEDKATGKVYDYTARDFLIYTVAYEMYATFHEEALKAQAVAAYTYFSVKRDAARAAGAAADFNDVCGTFPYTIDNLKQRYGANFDNYYAKISAAVDAVLGEKIYYNGTPIHAYYHAISNGMTETSENVWNEPLPYLQSVSSEWDTLAPKYEAVYTFTDAQVAAALASLQKDVVLPADSGSWTVDCEYTEAGYVSYVTIGDIRVTGRLLRGALEMHSAAFTVRREKGQFVFTCHGFGHGVGMSQYGADAMATQGYSYVEILKHYYTGVEVKPS